MFLRFSAICLWIATGLLAGCGADLPEFNSSQEFLDDTYIQAALDESGFETNPGDNPPSVSGKYAFSGSVSESTIPGISSDTDVESTVCLYGQAVGSINYVEQVEGFSGEGMASFIQGNEDAFTLYAMNSMDLSAYGYQGCSQAATSLISGIQDENGNVQFSTLVTYVGFSGCPAQFDTLLGAWYKTTATGTLQGPCSGPQDL
jgi:hypothetical protein